LRSKIDLSRGQPGTRRGQESRLGEKEWFIRNLNKFITRETDFRKGRRGINGEAIMYLHGSNISTKNDETHRRLVSPRISVCTGARGLWGEGKEKVGLAVSEIEELREEKKGKGSTASENRKKKKGRISASIGKG